MSNFAHLGPDARAISLLSRTSEQRDATQREPDRREHATYERARRGADQREPQRRSAEWNALERPSHAHAHAQSRLWSALVVATSPATVDQALALAGELARSQALPGGGSTRQLWEALATTASIDLGCARALEPHLDAVAILDQAQSAGLATVEAGKMTWGVFASEGGDQPVRAVHAADSWTLTGTKQWCSLAASLDSALVSAALEDGRRMLFAVELHSPGVQVESGTWHARGLAEIPSGPVGFDAVVARPVGDPGWYLDRPGFSWGGIGVAACWYGGAVSLARSLFVATAAATGELATAAATGKQATAAATGEQAAAALAAGERGAAVTGREAAAAASSPSSTLLLMHLGAVDELLQGARRALLEGAAMVDAGEAIGADGKLLAKRVRASVAGAVEETIRRVGHALGPAPLALDATHAKRVADLELYIRQHHAERDQLSLGRALLAAGIAPW